MSHLELRFLDFYKRNYIAIYCVPSFFEFSDDFQNDYSSFMCPKFNTQRGLRLDES